ncbi:type II and III secretion system protein family protein [Piscinibacter sp.]|uniref:type II and III secretion system protein family protein n=1 Tax=Piscinibacter sp. TaxID=1903157 RepID=UPI002B679516|nr:type II and III secretion system protein family protein [Albitalea sp.]HUG26556.1 type II and III secretion system protein family protein [Albitalea sp.]
MRLHRNCLPPALVTLLRRTLTALAVAVALTPQTPALGAGAQLAANPSRGVPSPVQVMAPCGRVEIAPVVQVSVGKSTVIRPPSPITRVLLGNPVGSRAARPAEAKDKAKDTKADEGEAAAEALRPGVADLDVLLLSPNEVYLLGKSIGSTNVVLLDRSGQCTAFDVVVTMDTGALQSVLGQLMPEERGVRVASAFDSVVLMGTVTDAAAVSRVLDLATAYVRNSSGGASVAGANPRIVNMLSTGAPQQVMLEVKVAEVSKALLDRWGINFTRAFMAADGQTMKLLSGLLGGVGAMAGQVSGAEGGLINGTIEGSLGTNGQAVSSFAGPVRLVNGEIKPVLGTGTTQFGIDAQKTDGLVKILAEPTVMAISGQKGSFLAGGKIFIPVSQETSAGGRTVTLEEKEFGVSVGFLPTVLEGGRINLQVATEVSELNRDGVGISVPGVGGLAVLPSFTSRSAKTTVQLMDGQSFAIGGLIKNNTTTNLKAFPFLGELPIVGALFRSTEFQTDKSELVFVITPRLAKPLPPSYALPTDNYVEPTRADLHLRGRLEGTRDDAPAAAAATSMPAAAAASAPSGGFQVK